MSQVDLPESPSTEAVFTRIRRNTGSCTDAVLASLTYRFDMGTADRGCCNEKGCCNDKGCCNQKG